MFKSSNGEQCTFENAYRFGLVDKLFQWLIKWQMGDN